jgi:hypothetical protein
LKKLILIITLVLIIVTSNFMFVYAGDKIVEAPNIRIIIDEEVINCDDVPIIINGRTMLPVRAILTKLGVQNDDNHIIWDRNERSVTIFKDTIKIKLVEGNNTAIINNELVTLDAAPITYSKNSRAYVPIRFIAQALNKAVVWEQNTSSVYIHRMLSQNEIWEEMHGMVNSKIISQDELNFSSKKIETSYVNELIAIAEKSDYDDKAVLIEILQRWQKGDFRLCVDDHNYLWGKQRSYVSNMLIQNMLSQNEMWVQMHAMANSKIISADDRYIGIVKIEANKVDELIAITEKSNYSDKDMLLDILYRWKDGDFRQCVDDHNYLWDKLGGEVGRAIRLMDDVSLAMENYIEPNYSGNKLGMDVGKAVSLTEEVKKAMENYIEPKQ